jgi:hypothetical protein
MTDGNNLQCLNLNSYIHHEPQNTTVRIQTLETNYVKDAAVLESGRPL